MKRPLSATASSATRASANSLRMYVKLCQSLENQHLVDGAVDAQSANYGIEKYLTLGVNLAQRDLNGLDVEKIIRRS